jgi:hypothetical protein
VPLPYDALFKGRLLAVSVNIRLAGKIVQGKNTLAFSIAAVMMKDKSD